MSQFVVSARKYRPLRFDDVVGQEHVSKTLKNAIRQDTLAHAFLFCGPRGVGKTTCARILAKVLNCQNVGEDTEPCGECESCKAFEKNASLNILELDAASNNSVEHIRSLIEQVRFQPQEGTFKIFIIDEVHMLSQQAFNAFLKTLEEPPPYAIFILATTEKHKIIPTILSRCQIFDFKRIQVDDIILQLKAICQDEGIEADEEALHVIATKADGALRDALSIFDKIASFGGKKITYQDVISNLNILDYEYYFKVVDAFALGDVAAVLDLFDKIQHLGFDGDTFLNGLAEHLRNLLVCKHNAIHHLLSLSDQLKNQYLSQSANLEESFLLGALDIANDCDINYKMAKNKRLHVEMALIKINYLQFGSSPNTNGSPQPVQEKKTKPVSDITKKDHAFGKSPSNGSRTVSSTEESNQEKVETETPVASKEVADAKTDVEGIETVPFKIESRSKDEMPSMSSLSHFIDAAKKLTEQNELKSTVVQLDQVASIWNDYASSQNSQTVRAVLEKTELDVKNNAIVATVTTMISKSVILQETALIERLRSELGLPRLTIRIEIDASSGNLPEKPKLLTSKEKFEHLCTQNPHFRTFQKNFGLKLDQQM